MSPGSLVLLDKALPYETTFHDPALRLLICIPRVLLARRFKARYGIRSNTLSTGRSARYVTGAGQ